RASASRAFTDNQVSPVPKVSLSSHSLTSSGSCHNEATHPARYNRDMPQVRVRRATVRDAPGIAHVHVQAWREAYARQLPAEVLDALQEEPRAKRWAAITEDELTDVYVAEVGRRIVGWASAGDGREEEAPVSRELHGIYVLRDVYGTGAGQQLLDAA